MSGEAPASASPTPDGAAAGPSPLLIGKRFVKQYYQVLSNTPDQLIKFYQPVSALSHGKGGDATESLGIDKYDLSSRFEEANNLRIDISAIDAQTSVSSSVLLVVTGQVVYSNEEQQETSRNAFVHTFFLTFIANTKRYYVHNDILRFLETSNDETEPKVELRSAVPSAAAEVESKPAEKGAPVAIEEARPVESHEAAPVVVEEPTVVAPTPVVDEDAAPGGGVEESKELEPEEQAAETKEPDETTTEGDEKPKKEGRGKRGKGRGKSPPEKQKEQQAAKPVPGSWASLVASGGSGPTVSGSVPPSPSRPSAPAATETKKAEEPAKAKADKVEKEAKSSKEPTKEGGARPANKQQGDRPKRDPDNTLVIKNLPDGTKDADLMQLFERFAIQSKAKVVCTNVSMHRGLGFVDYDGVAPVMAALQHHAKEPFQLNGRVLDVDQKTAEQKARRNARGNFNSNSNRSGSPGNNGRHGGGRGGQNQFNRRASGGGPGRGERGGGRGGRGGRQG